jgi:putative cardiolipin synthase
VTTALAHPEQTRLGAQFDASAKAHGGNSAYRLIPGGANGFLIRAQMINAAERTLDLQYFIFHGDDTGRLLTYALLRAADRGVRVRLLIDDGETDVGDEQIDALEAHPKIEIRIFNPFHYRGHNEFHRGLEFLLNASRLDYRMHNKLLVVDNAIALIGGRNVGDPYFQMDPDGQFADDDVFSAGPVARELSRTFDEFWNNGLSIPAKALAATKVTRADLKEHRAELKQEGKDLKADGADHVKRIASGEPLNGLLTGRDPLTWAHAQVVCDSPDKKEVEDGEIVGRLMHRAVANAALATKSELLMISPYLIPGAEGMQIFRTLRKNKVKVRVLTNSLESNTVVLAQAGYMRYRVPMLEAGVELYEIRSLLGNTTGSGETKAISRYGNYSLHGKMFVFDRQRVFIGSMNFDQRSMHLNTEIGLIIDSPVLAQQVATRFEAMVQPANAYMLALRRADAAAHPGLVWRTQEDGVPVEYDVEPERTEGQRLEARLLSWLPIEREL